MNMRLASLPRLPSELCRLPDLGYSEQTCRQFDEAHITFWDWLEGKRNEQVLKATPQTPKNKSWQAKYRSDAEILNLYYGTDRSDALVDPIAAEVTDAELLDLLNDLDDWTEGATEDATGEG